MLIPFRDVIITDGLMQSPPMQLTFGPARVELSRRSTARRARPGRFAAAFRGNRTRRRHNGESATRATTVEIGVT